MPRPENHEKPQLPVPCCAIRAENLQLLMSGAPSAENLAAPMRPPGDRAWGRRADFRVGITSNRTARSWSVRYSGVGNPMYLVYTSDVPRVYLGAWTRAL
jgi:hypothetical protein